MTQQANPPSAERLTKMSPSMETSERPATATSEAPTLIRQFPKEPRWLHEDDERTGGSEAADWRQKFVKVIAEHTKEMTTTERTEFFEACVTRNKERYIQTFAAYYGMHPEHIPERPGGVKSTEHEQKGMVESEEVFGKQSSLFKKTWLGDDQKSAFCAKTAAIEETVPGPKEETNPRAEPPTCQHCAKDAQKKKWLNPLSSVKKALTKKSKAVPRTMTPPVLQYDGTPYTASISSTKEGERSARSSLKGLPVWRPTEHAQHVEQQA